MEKELIHKMISTRRLKLTFSGYLTHYFVVILLFFPFILSLFYLLKYYITNTYTSVRTPHEMFSVNLPFAILGLIMIFIQYRRLKFVVVETNLTRKEILEIVTKTSDELNWFPLTNTKDLIVCKTRASLWTGSWGEQITIIFDNGTILINSICDPDRRASVTSWGRNRKNVNRFIELILTATNTTQSTPA